MSPYVRERGWSQFLTCYCPPNSQPTDMYRWPAMDTVWGRQGWGQDEGSNRRGGSTHCIQVLQRQGNPTPVPQVRERLAELPKLYQTKSDILPSGCQPRLPLPLPPHSPGVGFRTLAVPRGLCRLLTSLGPCFFPGKWHTTISHTSSGCQALQGFRWLKAGCHSQSKEVGQGF